MINDKEMLSFLSLCNRRNMIQIFDEFGNECDFDYQRHLIDEIEEVPGSSLENKVINSIVAVIYLSKIWLTHIMKCNYSKKFVLGIIIDNRWLKNGKGTPPYIVLNTINSKKILEVNSFVKIELVNYLNNRIVECIKEYFMVESLNCRKNSESIFLLLHENLSI